MPTRDDASDQVGAIAGEFRVDESGNASYTIPLYVVPGTAGVQPSLSLTYSSAAADGPMGKGWALSGTSAITRCRQTREHGDFRDASGNPVDGTPAPINYTSSDQFCLDGQRLLLHSGTHANHNAEYRPELDAFTRVTLISSGLVSAFKVQRKDGSTSFYGNFNGCTLSGLTCTSTPSVTRADALVYANTINLQGTVVARPEASAWALNRFYDSANNYIDYEYQTDSLKSEFVLSQVRYTGHARFDTDPTQPVVVPYASVSFTYADLPESSWRIGYNSGSRFVRSKRLTSINSNGVRAWLLDYGSASASGSGAILLRNIRECRDVGGTLCLKSTELSWFEGLHQFTDRNQTSQSTFETFVDSRFGDIDGDGRLDLVWINNTTSGCSSNKILISRATRGANGPLALTTPTDTGICTGWSSTSPTSGIQRFWQLLDYNGDGRDDLMLANPGTGLWRIHPSTGTGFDTTTDLLSGLSPALSAYVPTSTVGDRGVLTLADFNGDGVVDVLTPSSTGPIVRFLKRNGSSFAFSAPHAVILPKYASSSSCQDGCPAQFERLAQRITDINGDGRADLYVGFRASSSGLSPEGSPSYVIRGWFSAGAIDPVAQTIVFEEYSVLGEVPNPSGLPDLNGRRGDFNGDGLQDLLTGDNVVGYLAWINTGKSGPQAFTAVTGQALLSGADPQLADVNGDGRDDLLTRGNVQASEPWRVRYANAHGGFTAVDNGVLPGCENAALCGATAVENAQWYFLDLDGDGRTDYLSIKNPPDQSGNVLTGSAAAADRFQANELLKSVRNGYGALTELDYLPLTNTAVYRRDVGSRQTNLYGRLSPVLDLMMPLYVVSSVRSSAPTVTDANAKSTLYYRYAGAKLQGGGRGFLGFREITSFDGNYTGTGADNCAPGQSTCHMATRTVYHQHFPYIGAPQSTESWVLNGNLSVDACRISARGFDSCASGSTTAFQAFGQTTLPKLIKAANQGMACQGATDNSLCPGPYEGGAQCYPLNAATPFLDSSDLPMRSSTGQMLNSFTPVGTPQALFVYMWGNEELTFELQSPAASQASAQVFTVNCHDAGFGNLTVTETAILATPNSAEASKIRRKRTVNAYDNDTGRWQLGRLGTSEQVRWYHALTRDGE